MATPPKPWKAEYAKSGRSSCKTCKSPIDKDQFRVGKMVMATQFDGFMPMRNHAGCILKKANQIKSFHDVEGIDLLCWEDQEKIRKYVEGGSVNTSSTVDSDCAIEVSQTSRATCRRCNENIMKGTVRVSTKPEGHGARGVAWHHIHCFQQMSPSINIEKVSGWETLPSEEKAIVSSHVKKGKSTTKTESAVKEDKVAAPEQTSKGTKWKKDGNPEQIAKITKSEGSAACGGSSNDGVADLESKLKEQTNSLWDIKDKLKIMVMVKIQEDRKMIYENAALMGCCLENTGEMPHLFWFSALP